MIKVLNVANNANINPKSNRGNLECKSNLRHENTIKYLQRYLLKTFKKPNDKYNITNPVL